MYPDLSCSLPPEACGLAGAGQFLLEVPWFVRLPILVLRQEGLFLGPAASLG